ncbi:MAG: hypothetical protein AAGB18_02060 [Pseudomonadota bacterium]
MVETAMVENYTNAFLVSALVLCMLILTAIWAVWGFLAAVLIGYSTDRVIVFEARRVGRY